MSSGAGAGRKYWIFAAAALAVCGAVVIVANPDLVNAIGQRKSDVEQPSEATVTVTDNATGTGPASGLDGNTASRIADSGSSNTETDTALAVMEAGPDGYRALLNRLIGSGLMSEYGPEFTALLSGEQLRIANPCDLETFLGQLRAAETPEELRATLAPLAQALREAIKNNDPELVDIQRQLGVALLFAAEQVAESTTLTADQQLDRMVRIGGVLGSARIPELTLAMGDLAQGFLGVTDTPSNRRNIDAVLRTRLDASATVQDMQMFDAAAQQWMEMSRDKKDGSVGSRYRLYAQRVASFPSARINSQSGATWPGLSELSTNAILNIGTNWLRVPAGADRSGYIAARDGLVQQLDEVIRARGGIVSNTEDVRKLQNFRNKLASTRVR